eukprot:COSAG02_NODE_3168_length_7242_cov_2.120118_4_plen_81_part_00
MSKSVYGCDLRTQSTHAHALHTGGVWGPTAKRIFETCLKLADGDRNVDLYHWSSGQFSSTWYDTMSTLIARGRAKAGVAA